MNIDAAVPPKRSGLAILWDTIVAPNAAFESLRSTPKWLVAMIVTLVVGTIGIVMQTSATVHVASAVFARMIETNPSLSASLTPEKQQQAFKNLNLFYEFGVPLFYPVATIFGLLVTSAVIFIASLVARSKISFVTALAVSANAGFIYQGLFAFLQGLVALLRGPDGYTTPPDLYNALPSLAWIVPGAPIKLTAFLAMINVFTIWSFAINVLAFRKVAGLSLVWACALASLFFLTVAAAAVAGVASLK
jgi:hypothetical protein